MPFPLEVFIKVVSAVILGGVVGWQREARDRPAGLRTHILVCVGSAVYTIASLSFRGATSDPGRVAAQVVTGMGFLGAGTIIRHGSVVRGLTTAASLWTVAAIGLCVGLGGALYWVAGVGTLAVLLTLTLLTKAEQRWLPRGREAHLRLQLLGGPERLAEIQSLLVGRDVRMRNVELIDLPGSKAHQMDIVVHIPSDFDLVGLSSELAKLEGLVSMHCD
jgi:putative Mg2+ transporter-C (MgtC) family protein